MSELPQTIEDARRVIAEYDIAHPSWRQDAVELEERRREKRTRELAEARKAREAEKQQVASTDWYAAVDERVRTHFKNWAWAAIDERIQQHLDRHGDIFKDAVGSALGTIRKQVQDEFKRADEEQRRALEAKLAVLEERLASNDRILIETTGGPQGQARLREEIRHALSELTDAFGKEIAALERRIKAVPGKLPVAKLWQPDSVTYEAQVVSYDGASYQALRDTAQAPGGADWVCVARGGHDGLTPHVRGAYDAHKTYARLDLVEYDGSSFIARRDAPGVPGIPGDGWQLVSRSGRRGATGDVGPRGRKGERGLRGEDAPTIVSWHLERATYRAFPVFADGKLGAELNLRPLFEQYCQETSHAVE